MPIDPNTVSSLLQSLPAIFSEDLFIGRFLLAFEQVLTGLDEVDSEPKAGLEQIIAQMAALFDPMKIGDKTLPFDPKKTSEDFLPWLAGWVALSLRDDWAIPQKRSFLANIVSLYRRRGTKENLRELFEIFTGLKPKIDEGSDAEFQIGVTSTIGKDTMIGGSPPHFFRVTATMPESAKAGRQLEIAMALIKLQKPAHTTFTLDIVSETIQIGNPDHSTIGENTFIRQ